ncbi:MAG: OmpA family protein [Desulfofustis sp.]|jgi:chemotaxis protein MotB|nr:OmpA family protein [Desulfofustis sp.]
MGHKYPKNSHHPDPNRSTRFPPWLITYSDLITLLLTFFVLLMSMADLDPVRFDAASQSLKGAFGFLPRQNDSPLHPPIPRTPPIFQNGSWQQRIINALQKRLSHDLDPLVQGRQVQLIRTDSDTIMVRIHESLLFSPGSSRLNDGSGPLLEAIAEGIGNHPIELIAVGHSDASETGDVAERNWELSTARAVSVLRYFIEKKLLSPDRLSAAGYGDTHPLSGEAGLSDGMLNRRVDIILRARVPSGTGSASGNRSEIPL